MRANFARPSSPFSMRVHNGYYLAAAIVASLSVLPMSLTWAQSQRAALPRITAVSIYDTGSIGGTTFDASIDTHGGSCGTQGTLTPEPFFPTSLGLTIQNSSNVVFRVSKVRYELTRVGTKSRYRSPAIAPVGPLEVKANTEGTVYAPIMVITNSEKLLPGSQIITSGITGLRTMRLTLYGSINKQPITLSAFTTVSFKDVDRCAS